MKPCNAATYRRATLELAMAAKPRVIVEVGVYAGDLSKILSALPSVERYYIVDSWAGDYCSFGQEHMDKIADSVFAWARTNPKVTVHRMDSADGAKLFEDASVDFFHTDGTHTLEGISADINNWRPKVRAGGIMSGDNYEIPAVAEGVTKLLPHHKIGAKGRLWWARV